MITAPSESRIIVFLRAPEKGRVKTRLAKSFPDDDVLELYKGFVIDTVSVSEKVAPPLLYCWPPEKMEIVKKMFSHYSVFPQNGNDLGEKMYRAFQECFSCGVSKALLIGTDIPEITEDILIKALGFLDWHDIVLGPSRDGGYYLIGLTRLSFDPDLFKNIPWSTACVLNDTIAVAGKKGFSIHRLPELNDIDTPEDLKGLLKRSADLRVAGRKTAENLSRLRFLKK